MKLTFLSLLAVSLAILSPITQAEHVDDIQITAVEDFFEPLSDHGVWIKLRPFGWCWYPSEVDREWRPYVDGRWIETEDGPYWDSEEPWAWATYHYGRWFYDKDHGWLWVPDTQWAPAWVDWRNGEEVVGWAPMPPRVYYEERVEVYSEPYYIEPASYVFVEHVHFWHPIHFGLVFFHHDHRCHRHHVHNNCDAFHSTSHVSNFKQVVKIKNSSNVTVNQNATINQSSVKVKGRNNTATVTQGSTGSSQQTITSSGQNVSGGRGQLGDRNRGKRIQQPVIGSNQPTTTTEPQVLRGGREKVQVNRGGNSGVEPGKQNRQTWKRALEAQSQPPRSPEIIRGSPSVTPGGRGYSNRGQERRLSSPSIGTPSTQGQIQKFRPAEQRQAQIRQQQQQQPRLQPAPKVSQSQSGGGRRSPSAEERAEWKANGGRGGFKVD